MSSSKQFGLRLDFVLQSLTPRTLVYLIGPTTPSSDSFGYRDLVGAMSSGSYLTVRRGINGCPSSWGYEHKRAKAELSMKWVTESVYLWPCLLEKSGRSQTCS